MDYAKLGTIEVGYKAVGFEESIKVSDLPESTVVAALIYGVRRLIQDSCNSEAFKLREERGLTKADELPEEDRKVIHEARLGAMLDGTIGAKIKSGAKAKNGLSAEHSRVLAEYRAKLLKDSSIDPKEYKAADAEGRTKLLVEWMVAETASHDRWTKAGAALIEADKVRAEAIKGLDI